MSETKFKIEFSKYITVGGLGYIVDIGLFNLLSLMRIGGHIEVHPMSAKAFSLTAAIVVTYILHAQWTFAHRSNSVSNKTSVLVYASISLVGGSVSLVPLFISREILGFHSLIADNLAANVIGTGLAFVFKFVLVRNFVFTDKSKQVALRGASWL